MLVGRRVGQVAGHDGGSAREVLCLGGRFGFGGVGADVCDPVVDECQEPVEAAGGQLAERDLRPQAGQVRRNQTPSTANRRRHPGASARYRVPNGRSMRDACSQTRNGTCRLPCRASDLMADLTPADARAWIPG
jgi:hypothetical protein